MLSYKVIGAHIRQARERKGLKQVDVADMIKMSPSYYGKIERGENRQNLDVLAEICKVLDIPFDSIFRGALMDEANAFENMPSAAEEFDAFFREMSEITDDRTKRTMMRLCSVLVKEKNEVE